MVHLSLIKPFEPSSDIDWTEVGLETNALMQYKDERAERELNRFLLRDLAAPIIMQIYVFGMTFFPAVIISNGVYTLLQYFCGLIVAGTGALDGLLHIVFDNTPEIARVRRWLQTIGFIAIAPPVTVSVLMSYDHCQDALEFTKLMGIPRPENTPAHVDLMCRQIIPPFLSITVTCTMMSFGFTPVMLPAILAVLVLLEGTGRLYTFVRPETPTEAAIRWIMFLIAFLITSILFSIRYRGATNQLKQALTVVRETTKAKRREEEVDLLLCAMVPSSALIRLSFGDPVSDFTHEATVLFSDMVQFTAWSSKRTAQQVVAMLNVLCIQFDHEAVKRGVEKVKTIGDAYWAVTGLPDEVELHAEVMCDFANKMLDIVEEQNKRHPEWEGVRLRIGIHSGPLAGGILGTQQLSYEVFGKTSHVAEEVEKAGTPSHVTVSHFTMEFLDLPTEVTMQAKSTTYEGITYQLYVLRRETIEKHRERAAAPGGNNLGFGMQDVRTPSQRGSRRSRADTSSQQLTARTGSFNGSVRSRRTVGEAEAKERRQKFIEQRAIVQAETAAPTESLAEISERYSRRRWNWVLMDFAERAIEDEYQAFVAELQAPLRIASRLATMIFMGTIILCILIDDGKFGVASAVFFPLAFITNLIDCAMYYNHSIPPLVSSVIHLTTSLFLILATGLMPPGSTATNDITYVHAIVTMLTAMGNVGIIPAAALFVININIFLPLVVYFIWEAVMISVHIIFLGQSALLILFVLVIMEKQYRRQFLENRVAKYFEDKQEQRNKEQAALLASIVPHHVIDELMVWLATDMDTNKTIVKRFPEICVCFIKLSTNEYLSQIAKTGSSYIIETVTADGGVGKRTSTTILVQDPSGDQLNNSQRLGSTSILGVPEVVSMPNTPNQLDAQAIRRLPMNGEDSVPPTPTKDGMAEADEEDGDGGEAVGLQLEIPEENVRGPAELEETDWLAPAHVAVDAVLKKYSAIDKIKTIGELVMIAGPFNTSHSICEATDQMLAATAEIRSIAGVQAGMHVGEIVGAVLGTNRLCFDIFGDTVNTASRCMSGGGEGEITVSAEYHKIFNSRFMEDGTTSGGVFYCDGAEFSDPIGQQAKGKGILEVRRVREVPIVRVDSTAH